MRAHRIIRRRGHVYVSDEEEAILLASVVNVSGYWCPACGFPRTPYPGDDGVHPTCPRPGRARGLAPKAEEEAA